MFDRLDTAEGRAVLTYLICAGVVIWYSISAKRAGRFVIGWAIAGVAVYMVPHIVVGAVLVSLVSPVPVDRFVATMLGVSLAAITSGIIVAAGVHSLFLKPAAAATATDEDADKDGITIADGEPEPECVPTEPSPTQAAEPEPEQEQVNDGPPAAAAAVATRPSLSRRSIVIASTAAVVVVLVVVALVLRPRPPHTPTAEEISAIMAASAKGDVAAIKKVLWQNPAAIDARTTPDGYTPLHWAADRGRTEAVEYLIGRGAKVDARNLNIGATPLYLAACGNRLGVIRALHKAGADMNAKTKGGLTALHVAEDPKTINYLVKAGGRINARDNEGWTPLFYATTPRVARALLANGADINARADDGSTPLHRAASLWQGEPVDYAMWLVAKGARLDARDDMGNTPLHIAGKNLDVPEMAKALVAAGADTSARNVYRDTPSKARDREVKQAHEDTHEMCRSLISLGREDSIKLLLLTLRESGDLDLATEYLNSGNPVLVSAAKEWGRERGLDTYNHSTTRKYARWGQSR